jgi:hypothetical protein
MLVGSKAGRASGVVYNDPKQLASDGKKLLRNIACIGCTCQAGLHK